LRQNSRRVVDRPSGKRRHDHFTRLQRDPHGSAGKEDVCHEQSAAEEQKLTGPPDPVGQSHEL
jgi:hypothetical protein